MELMEVLKKLSDEEQKIVTDAIEAEKSRGITESRKKGEEVKKHMTAANAMRDRIKTLDLDPDDETLDDKIAALKEKVSGKKENTELAKLQREVKKLVDERDTEKRASAELKERYTQKTLSESLRKAIGDKIQAPDFVISGLVREGKVKLSEDEKPVFVFGDGDTVDFDKGAARWMAENPSIVKNPQGGGGGSRGNQGKTEKIISLDEFNKLPATDRAAYAASGGKVT